MSERIVYYGMDGKPVSFEEGMTLFKDFDRRCVRQTHTPNRWLVSTVLLVLDHSFGGGPPVLFETMVFPDVAADWRGREVCCERYHTAEEARAGHARALERALRRKLPNPRTIA